MVQQFGTVTTPCFLRLDMLILRYNEGLSLLTFIKEKVLYDCGIQQ